MTRTLITTIDLVPEPALHRMLLACTEAGNTFDLLTLLSASKYAAHVGRESQESGVRLLLDDLVRGGFLSAHVKRSGETFWRFSEDAVASLCVALAGGCTPDEIQQAPAWLRAKLREWATR